MKTYVTVSLGLEDTQEQKMELYRLIEEAVHNAVDVGLVLMRDKQLVQIKITNLPMRKEDY